MRKLTILDICKIAERKAFEFQLRKVEAATTDGVIDMAKLVPQRWVFKRA